MRGWQVYNNSDTVFVFVHGVFSDAIKCWTSPCGVYWPSLVAEDARFKEPAIFMAEYYTAVDSNDYGIKDCAEEVFHMLHRSNVDGKPAPANKKNIVFIAHSTGGIVVRYMLEANSDAFVDKNIGVCLYASPSLGSKWSSRFRALSRFFNNKLAQELTWESHILQDLDDRFLRLLEAKKLSMCGMEAYENKAPFSLPFLKTRVVKRSSANRYFGSGTLVADSDHSSIVKPVTIESHSHQVLLDFSFENNFLYDRGKSLFDRPSLFDRYSSEYEDYYVQRSADEEIVEVLGSYSVWVCGQTGLGKTASISRSLDKQKIQPFYISLGACINFSMPEIMEEICLEVVGEDSFIPGKSKTEYIKKISRFINDVTDGEVYYLLIEEIPINSEDMFFEFSDCIYAIVSAIKNSANFRIILSSIYEPNTILDPEMEKITERIKVIRWNSWSDDDIEILVDVITRDLGVGSSDIQVADFSGVPREVKEYFRGKLSRIK